MMRDNGDLKVEVPFKNKILIYNLKKLGQIIK